MEGGKGDGANPQSTQYFHSKRKFASQEDCEMSEAKHEVRGRDACMGNKSFDGPTRLKHKISKDLEKLKQLRATCSENQENVLDKMLASYEEAVAILNKFASKEQDQGQGDLAPSWPPDDFDNSSMDASACVDRRKQYRRRKKTECWKVKSREIDDGFGWRKYGQKDILGAKHPRNYYRCIHKYDKGCPATKQVQKSDEDPMIFDVVYSGKHTCGLSPVEASDTQAKIHNKEVATSVVIKELQFSE